MCAKRAKPPNGASLGTPDAWKPGAQPIGPWLSWRSVDTFAVNPWLGYPQTPAHTTTPHPAGTDPTPGIEGKRTA